MKTSKYKQHILDVLGEHHLLSIKDIHAYMPDADFSTIFRNIEQLAKEGIVKKVTVSKDHVLYELAHHAHDHFVCDDCGDVQEVDARPYIPLPQHIGSIADVVMRGTCTACNHA
ncbi:MAG: transcriptional repressor [Candidatus Pacebacteria bacterium]|nr:transcriptional repressor [Candidatus Paceibacterota bacterium]MCD8528133.1 transcriptional repressor [Candidatus Paceibacterota bacterium]MCD8563507.1 transcriptional repressor [Candidatus Paceibacterota bacterium]